MKKIILTGGGTAGHVTPNIALLPLLYELGYEIIYIGSHNGIEKELIEETGIKYYPVSTGKLRRYKNLKNLSDPFRVVKGLIECINIIRKEKPNIIFSKGGYVGVPVTMAGKILNIPVIIHESDMTPGLANKLAIPFSKKVLCSFEKTLSYLPKNKGIYTGAPIRSDILLGDKKKGLDKLGFKRDLPVLLIIGGSLGASVINQCVFESIHDLLDKFNVLHIVGRENINESLLSIEGYKQFDFVKEDLKDFFKVADIMISRAGANSVSEILALKKPALLIPLSKNASRGDQILNSQEFKEKGYSEILYEEDMNRDSLVRAIFDLYNNKEYYFNNMNKVEENKALLNISNIINEYSK